MPHAITSTYSKYPRATSPITVHALLDMAMSDTSSPPSRSSAGQLELKSAPEPSTRKRKKTGQNENMPRKKAAKADAHIQATKSDTDAPEEQAGIDDAFAKMDGPLLSDYLAQKTRKFEKHLSVVELEDRHIPGQ